MTSWILPEKEKPPSVDSDFSCIVLTVYKLTRNDFHSNTADVVHPLHPQHLIFRKRGLPLRPLFRKAILPAEKTLLLPADQCQQDNCSVCRWLADWCNAPSQTMTNLKSLKWKFYTITNLQGSQTYSLIQPSFSSFTPLQTYKVLKQLSHSVWCKNSFTPLQTYKVLKQVVSETEKTKSFTPLQTYKVLKPAALEAMLLSGFTPLQTYKVLKLML